MKEIDRIAKRVKALKKLNSPFMLAYIMPNKEVKNFNCSYEIKSVRGDIINGSQNCDTRELAKAYCNKLQDKYNISEDKCYILNITTPRGD